MARGHLGLERFDAIRIEGPDKKGNKWFFSNTFLEENLSFFEGAEKKVEIVVTEGCDTLLSWPSQRWTELLRPCGASILSEMENRQLKAFLLSESSMFVWDNRILLLTCGQTRLIESILRFVKEIGAEHIKSIIFQRKNEHLSHLQPSDFYSDVEKMRTLVDGKALRFGKIHGHHNLLFHSNRPFYPDENDTTIEFLMYDLGQGFANFLTRPRTGPQEIRSHFLFEGVLGDFSVDDFCFSPCGYSLNAIQGQNYYTVHITPQGLSSYASFETNIPMDASVEKVFHHLLDILNPSSFDLMTFNNRYSFHFERPYFQVNHSGERLSNGYNVDFHSFYKESNDFEKAEDCR